MIKLIATDLDGTLLDDGKYISSKNIETLRKVQEKGIEVVACTGRTLPGVLRFIEMIYPDNMSGYLIVQNGAAIYELPSLKPVRVVEQDTALRRLLVEYFMTTKDEALQIVAFDTHHFYLIEATIPNEQVLFDSQTLNTPITCVQKEEFYSIEGIQKMMVLGTKEVLDEWQSALPDTIKQAFNVVRSQPTIVEFLSPGIHKAAALIELTKQLHITADQVMAIGDEENDLEMLRWAKHSVAMGNAPQAVKQTARYVTESNHNDGVAVALEQYVLMNI